MTSDKRILARNISSTFLVQIANYIIPMISVPIIVRIIGPEKYGMINYAGAVITYFTLLINYSFNLTAARQIAQHKTEKDIVNATFNNVFGTKIFLFLVSTLLFLLCFLIIPTLQKNSVVFLSSYLVCIAWVFTPDWLYQGMGDLHRIAIFNLITKVAFTVLIIFIIHKPSDYYWQPLSFSLAQIVVALISWNWVIKKYYLKIHFPSLKSVLNILYRDRLIFFSGIIISLYTTTNILILGWITNTLEVGYFSAAQRFIIIAQSVITLPLAQSIFPHISEAFGKSKEQGVSTVVKIAPYIVLLTFVLGVLMVIVGPWFIEIYFGHGFSKSKIMFCVMSFIPFIVSINDLYGTQLMLNLHMNKPFFRIIIIGALLGLMLNTLLVKSMGGLGSSISWLITEVVITIIMGVYLYYNNIQIFSLKQFLSVISFKRFNNIFSMIKQRRN